jgi:serine protein kinase
MDTTGFLAGLKRDWQERFVSEKRILSFGQYLKLFEGTPDRLGRSSAQYLKGVLDYHGTRAVPTPGGELLRYSLFDIPFEDGRERLIGQEEVQQQFYRILSNFAQEGRASRLVLLHGPNGSAKTSFVQCLARGMVDYSGTDDGAVYAFNWIFPKSSYLGKRVGFDAGGDLPPDQETFAFLEDISIAARVPAELRDHPLFLIPKSDRKGFLENLAASGNLPEGFRFSDHLAQGDLGPVSRRIFDALLTSYGGNIARVLAHVQVERVYFSRRYRQGLVTVEPQMHVDAAIRQLTMDESYGNLPAVLRHVPMFELSGDLVDAHRGILEFSDMLKRPMDTFKYLLGTCESGSVSVTGAILFLDLIFVGTTNDKYLAAFTKTPDFPSFKGRMELVRVPYIRSYRVEQGIYDLQVTEAIAGKHVAPHANALVALWATLTRLRRCDPALYPEPIRPAVEALTPIQKADLYADGTPPSGVKPDIARELRDSVELMLGESRGAADYEGSVGASPREAKGALLSAAHADRYECLHPVQVFEELESLLEQRSLYEFLQMAPAGDYHNQPALLESVRARYAEWVDTELKQAMGLVSDADFERLLKKYATHASAFLKKERVMDPVTRQLVPPDEDFMKELEDRFQGADDRDRARQDFLGRVASHSLDNPGAEREFRLVFPDLFHKLKGAYYEENKNEIARSIRQVLDQLDGRTQDVAAGEEAASIIKNLKDKFGYCDNCIAPALTFLSKRLVD